MVRPGVAFSDAVLHKPGQGRQHIDGRIDVLPVQLPVQNNLPLCDVACQVRNGMGNIVVGHGENGYLGWGYGAGMTYGRSWLLSKRWNMEVEAGLGLLVAPYTKYRCEHCGDKVKSGTYFLPTPKLAFNLVYLF